MLQDLMLF